VHYFGKVVETFSFSRLVLMLELQFKNMKNIRLIVLVFLLFKAEVQGADSTLHASVFCAGRVSRYYNSSHTNPSEQIWNFRAAPVPGFQLGGLVHWRNFRGGMQYSQNYYRRWEHFNYANLGTRTAPNFDSLYGQLWLHLIELLGGYSYKISPKLEVIALGRYGPRSIKGKGYTVGRYHKDSVVYGLIKKEPRYSIGFDVRFNYKITRLVSLTLGLHYEKTTFDQNLGYGNAKKPKLDLEPRENMYFPSGHYYGANFGLVYTLK
jgi:hypothetical protein